MHGLYRNNNFVEDKVTYLDELNLGRNNCDIRVHSNTVPLFCMLARSLFGCEVITPYIPLASHMLENTFNLVIPFCGRNWNINGERPLGCRSIQHTSHDLSLLMTSCLPRDCITTNVASSTYA